MKIINLLDYLGVKYECHVLLVEDNLVNQEVSKEKLEFLGCTVDVAENGLEAVKAFAKIEYDFIFMDCQMPVMDGYEATIKIREIESSRKANEHIPIIALTAHAVKGDREQCLEAGMDDYLCKPFSIDKIKDYLERWISKKRTLIKENNPLPLYPDFSYSRFSRFNEVDKENNDVDKETLDRRTLDSILCIQRNGGRNLLESVIKLYRDESPRLLENLRHAVNQSDCSTIKNMAHSLNSCSGNIGASKLVSICNSMEKAARMEESEKASLLLPLIEKEYNNFIHALTQELESLK